MLRVCAAAALMAWLAPLSHAEAADQVVFLVRHAERAPSAPATTPAAGARHDGATIRR